MAQKQSRYAQKGLPAKYSEEYQNLFLATQVGSKTAGDADFWRQKHSRKFSAITSFSYAQNLHYSNCPPGRKF